MIRSAGFAVVALNAGFGASVYATQAQTEPAQSAGTINLTPPSANATECDYYYDTGCR